MASTHTSISINGAGDCRAKAASLRREAKAQASPVAAEQLMEIARYWDQLTVDYELTKKPTFKK